jgi:transposase-like protein
MRLPPLSSLLAVVFNDNTAQQYLETNEVFYTSLPCPGCGNAMQLMPERGCFWCSKRDCGKEISMRKYTFFYGSSLKCSQIMLLAYCWLNQDGQQQAMNITGHSPNTVTTFYRHFRRLVASTLLDDDQIIGGPGIVVEVDETKLGKRKYNCGHRVEGVWIIVGVEKTAERKCFLSRVENRSAETLIPIIEAHVDTGSIVNTDMWKGYSALDHHPDYEHHIVNHSRHFRDPETGVNTNTIEGTNNALKIMIKPRNRTAVIEDHLFEFVWRRKNRDDLWGAFMCALKDIHYDME